MFNRIKIKDFLYSELVDEFELLLPVFGLYNSTNKKSIILIWFKHFITDFIQDEIIYTFNEWKNR